MTIFKAGSATVPAYDALYDVHDWAVERAIRDPKFGAVRDRLATEIRKVEQGPDSIEAVIELLRLGIGLHVTDLRTMGFWWRKPGNLWWKIRQRGHQLVGIPTGRAGKRYYLEEYAPCLSHVTLKQTD